MSRTSTSIYALAAIALLVLTGCSSQDTAANIPPASPSTTASSAASPKAESSADEETPTTETTENYSGGSKAPEGEYRPADEHGPAQNVPRPERPQGMDEESEEGLFKFLSYWNDAANYGIQTGDFSTASSLITDEYTVEEELYLWGEEIYRRGGWVVGGRRELVVGEGLLLSHGNGHYTWGGNLNVENMQAHLDGPGPLVDNSWSVNQGIYFDLYFVDGQWKIDGVIEVPAE